MELRDNHCVKPKLCAAKFRTVYAQLLATYPWAFLLVPLGISGTLAHFAIKLTSTIEDPVLLYVSKSAPSIRERVAYFDFTKQTVEERFVDILIERKDGGSVLQKETVKAVSDVYDFVYRKLTVTLRPNGTRYTFAKLCRHRFRCQSTISDLKLFFSLYEHRNTSLKNSTNFQLTYPTARIIDKTFLLSYLMSNVSLSKTGELADAYMLRLMLVVFVGKENSTVMQIEALQKLGRALLDFVVKLDHENLTFMANYWNSASDGMIEVSDATTPKMAISILGLALFTIISSVNLRNCAESFGVEAVAGIVNPILGIISGIGFCVATGAAQWNGAITVMPFLVLTIGIDDMFVLLKCWKDAQKKALCNTRGGLDLPTRRVAFLLDQAGLSVTITSLINVLSFLFGLLQDTPVIRSFSIFTAVALTFEYAYQMSFFLAVLVIRERRDKCFRRCMKYSDQTKHNLQVACFEFHGSRQLAQKFRHMAKSRQFSCNFAIVRSAALFIALAIFASYVLLSVYLCSQAMVQLSPSKVVMDNSPLHSYYDKMLQTTFIDAQRVSVIVHDPPCLENETEMESFQEAVETFESAPLNLGSETTELWLRRYIEFAKDADQLSVRDWLSIDSNAQWRDLIILQNVSRSEDNARISSDPGDDYAEDLVTPEDCSSRELESFEFRLFYKVDGGMQGIGGILNRLRMIAQNYSSFNMTVYNVNALLTDQIAQIPDNVMQDTGLTILAICLVSVLLVPQPLTMFIVAYCILTVEAGVIGILTSFCNADLDSITLITITMSVGFSVDYLLHAALASAETSGGLSKRISAAFGNSMSWPIFQAAASTVLGIAGLLFVPAYLPRIFALTTILVACLGLLHGLVYMNLLLYVLGFIPKVHG